MHKKKILKKRKMFIYFITFIINIISLSEKVKYKIKFSEDKMRLRNVPGSREAIAESEYAINEPELNKGKWKEIFGNDNPIRIEIGMGKGKFITTLAQQNPDINYIGIEKFSSVLIRAIEKMEELELTNLKFIRMDAEKSKTHLIRKKLIKFT